MTNPRRVLIIGAHGQFGRRIASRLAEDTDIRLICAGRNPRSVEQFTSTLNARAVGLGHEGLILDACSDRLAEQIAAVRPEIVVHCAGPFQGQDYRVAKAALACDAHYIDLADSRRFVNGILCLDDEARSRGRWAISGASSVPALSAAVVAFLNTRFQRMDRVEVAISPGNRTERGDATTRAILGYVGCPYPALIDGVRQDVHGWQSLRVMRGESFGSRWLARCEVPDLDCLPQRYPDLRHCDFRAGLELRRMHFGLWALSWMVRARLIRSLPRWAGPLLALSRRWINRASDRSVMQVETCGTDHWGNVLRLRWRLIAEDGSGPQVPATPAVVLVRKLLEGTLVGGGARPCLDLIDLDEVLDALRPWPIRTIVEQLDV